MQNELCRIGAIIYDLKRNLKFLPSAENQGFLDNEFRRIALSLGVQWNDKAMGWEYLLEFHREEADRLSESLDDLYVGNLLHGRRSDYMDGIYNEIQVHLVELTRRIDKMTADRTDFRVN
jgi:hypothetical protein